MDYYFEREGVKEAVDLERWGWGVVYKDGTELHQFGSAGDFHQFAEIVRENVAIFVLYRTDDMTRRVDIPVVEGMQLFHFYTRLKFEANTPDERKATVICFGWKRAGEEHYVYVLPDDRIVCASEKVGDFVQYGI